MRAAALALLLGAATGYLAACPVVEVRADRTLGVYASAQPRFTAEDHRARLTNDGYLKIERSR